MTIAINSDTLVNLTGHQDTVTGGYINTATVTAAILDGASTLFTVSMPYVAASSGNYQGNFTASQTGTLTPGKTYVVQYVATSSHGTLTVQSSQSANYIVS